MRAIQCTWLPWEFKPPCALLQKLKLTWIFRLPYVGQGAGQAIEDVGVLRLALNRLSTREELPVLLKTYEVARKPRAEQIISTSDTTRIALHLPDGPQQQARDEKFRAVAQGGDNPDLLWVPRLILVLV
jgi:2-polyprenyl-6-methoxyphenol hydroxylase-like FAD-dependent oxidoreductase